MATMYINVAIGISVAVLLEATLTMPAMSASAKSRVANPARYSVPAYGIRPFRARSANPAYDVYHTSGKYSGSDPDAFIRTMLAHDPPWASSK
jgi:hypothetical protein